MFLFSNWQTSSLKFFMPHSLFFILFLPLPQYSLSTQTLTMNWKEKLGNYLIDISKYFATGVLFTALIKDMEDWRWLIYLFSGIAAIFLLVLGLFLTNKKED